MKDINQRMRAQLAIIRDLGFELPQKAVVVDLGCGNGDLVKAYMDEGFNAFGCDFKFKEGGNVASLKSSKKILEINPAKYALPFESNSIDFIVTDQVFEHVADYEMTLAEMHRVLKPGGISLNFFPSRYKIIEPHVFVPFATVVRQPVWLAFWAALGVKKSTQKGLKPFEIAKENLEYLNANTYYLKKRDIRSKCEKVFTRVRFAEGAFIRHSRRVSFLGRFSRSGLLPGLYSTFRQRVLFLQK